MTVVSVPGACWRPRHGICLTLPPAWNPRRDAPQLPLRLGGTRQDCRLPGAVRTSGFGPQQQGRASCVCEASVDENPVAGGIRTAGSDKWHRLRCLQPIKTAVICQRNGKFILKSGEVYIWWIRHIDPIRCGQTQVLFQRKID